MAAAVKVVANRKFMGAISKMLNTAIGETVRELRDEIRKNVSTPFPPSSSPGNPPHMRTGEIKRAIFAEKIAMMDWIVGVRRVSGGGSPSRQFLGLWLELGTGNKRKQIPAGATIHSSWVYNQGRGGSSMAPRPYLLNTILKRGPSIFKSKFRSTSIISHAFGSIRSFFSSLFGGA